MLKKNSKEKGNYEAKEEGISNYSLIPKAPSTSTNNSRQWSGFRNPRIVRVSRSFGGKDRHSKVCTIRGLRDRRIRLSVPTAIQLYDLQDKLKLGQPSKVIDWLLDVTKLDIDKLPPLPIPTGFSPFHQHMLFPPYSDSNNSSTSSSFSQFCSLPPPAPPPFHQHVRDVASQTAMEKTKNWDVMDLGQQEKASSAMKGKWIMDGGNNNIINLQIENYNSSGYNNYNSSDQPSCLSLSQFGNNNNHNNNGVFNPSQIEVAQTSSSSSSSFSFTPYASYISNPFENHIHFLSSNSHNLSNPFITSPFQPFGSQNLKPFSPNFNLKHDDSSGKDAPAGDA